MKKNLSLLLILAYTVLFTTAVSAQVQNGSQRAERLAEYVYYFASDSLKGRKAGTADAIKARDYIIERFKECGVKPYLNGDYVIPFQQSGTTYSNAVGIIEGNSLKDEYIVLGAHFDHLGVKKGEIYPGADDNASGSAALIEIARELVANRESLQRSVIIAAFDGEELGLYGSNSLADLLDATVGIENVKLMISVDMVGWYRQSGKLIMEGVATIRDGKVLVGDAAKRHSINVKTKNFETSVLTATDTQGFAKKHVPTLAVTTGLKSPYHKPGDKPELIDYEGLDKVTGYLADVATVAASDPEFASSGKVAPKHEGKAPLFQGGVQAGLGGASIAFPNAGIGAEGRMNYSAGLMGRLNLGKAGLQVSVLYDQSESRFPNLAEPLGKPQNYMQRAVTVPAILFVQYGDYASSMYAGFGGYYSYAFQHSFSESVPSWSVAPHQGGLAASFGMIVGGLMLSWDFRWQLSELFPDGAKARLNTGSYITLGWMF